MQYHSKHSEYQNVFNIDNCLEIRSKLGVGHCYDVIMSDGVSNLRRLECLLNRLFRHRSNKISKPRVTGLCVSGMHQWPVDFSHKVPVTLKMFPLNKVIMKTGASNQPGIEFMTFTSYCNENKFYPWEKVSGALKTTQVQPLTGHNTPQ